MMNTGKFSIYHHGIFLLSISLTMLVSAGSAIAGAHGDGSKDILNEAERASLRQFYDQFAADMDEKYFARVRSMNSATTFEDRTAGTEWTDYELRVARGDVMEKAGRMLTDGKKTSPGRGDGELTWGRFYSLDMHPKTPLVGMLHATIVLQMYADGSVATGGWLGVMPGTRVEADLTRLRQLTDDYFAQHDKDPTLYRRLICKGTEETIAEFRRQPACSGVSFYGPPVYRGDPEASIKFIAGLFDAFINEYMDITQERADDAYTEADLIAQQDMRRRWLIDQLFSDPFASKIVPFEVWSFANVPPVITF